MSYQSEAQLEENLIKQLVNQGFNRVKIADEEQRKIASILCRLDSKLKREHEKLDSLNEYKKGLLQQMFV